MRAAMKARARKDFIVTVPGYSVPLILGFTLYPQCGVYAVGRGHALIWCVVGSTSLYGVHRFEVQSTSPNCGGACWWSKVP